MNDSGSITRCVRPLRGCFNLKAILTQPAKSSRQRDRVLDRDVVARHDHPLDQQPDEPLPPLKVEFVQPVPQGRREGGEILSQLVEPSLVHFLRQELFTPHVGGPLLLLQPFPARLEFLDRDPAGLVGIYQALNLPLESTRSVLEAAQVLRPLRGTVIAYPPGLDLAPKHLGALNPRHDCVPDHTIEFVSPHATRVTFLFISVVTHVVVTLAAIEEVLVASAQSMLRRHPVAAVTTDNQRSKLVVVLNVPRRHDLFSCQRIADTLLRRLIDDGRDGEGESLFSRLHAV